MTTNVKVRLITEADRQDWLDLWKEWQVHMKRDVPDHISARSWSMLIREGSGLLGLIAREGKEAIGFATMSAMPFAWTGSEILYLQDLYVRQSNRSGGVGSAIIREIYALADARGADQVFWMVDEDDARLHSFYNRHAIRTPYLRYVRKDWPW